MMTADFQHDRRCSLLFAASIALAYLILLLVQMSHHVMWRDELHPWQVLRPCKSIPEAVRALRYDGVPPVWNGIVYLLTRFSDEPRWLQLTHALIASGVVFVFAGWSPFSRVIKVLFPLGYFPLYEYGVITRSYSLLFLLLLIACVILCKEKYNLFTLAGVLLLLMLTSLWGAGFATLMMGYALYERPRKRAEIIAVCLILLAGLLLCIASVTPGPGNFFASRSPRAPFTTRFPEILATIWKGMIPIPKWNRHFWNSNILDGHLWMQAGLGAVLFGALIYSIRRDRTVTVLFVLGALGLLGFAYIFPGFTRHHGHLFILFIVCSWLVGNPNPILLRSLLWLQAAIGIGVAVAAMTMPFTDSKLISSFIRTNVNFQETMLIGIPDYSTSPISQWLDQPIYFLDMRKFARVNTQNDEERPGLKPQRFLPVVYSILLAEQKPAILIAESGIKPVPEDGVWPVKPDLPDGRMLRFKTLATFDQGIVATESGTVYSVTIEQAPATRRD